MWNATTEETALTVHLGFVHLRAQCSREDIANCTNRKKWDRLMNYALNNAPGKHSTDEGSQPDSQREKICQYMDGAALHTPPYQWLS